MKLKMTILLVGCMFMIILVGCDITPTPHLALYNVSGTVCDPGVTWGIPGTTVIFSGGYGSVTTEGNGSWSKTGLSGAVTIVPSKLGFTFEPSYRQVLTGDSDILFRMTGFTDYFNNIASGWTTSINNVDADCSYQSGEYEIKTKANNLVAQTSAPFAFAGDYTVQVDCRQISGTVGSYGIVFDYSEAGDYYYFGVDPFARAYFLMEKKTGSWVTPEPIAALYTEWINGTASNVNTVKVVKTGTQVELWVNDHKLKTATSELSVFHVSLCTESDGLITTRFDNFQFTGPGIGGSSLSLKTPLKTMRTMALKGFEVSSK